MNEDCPTLPIAGTPTPLACEVETGVEQPDVSVPIEYCHIYPGHLQDPDLERYDFAYCILSEEPDINPVPIIMGCEVDAFLGGDDDLEVMVAGFGIAGNNGNLPEHKPGHKRWATASLGGTSFSSGDSELLFGMLSFDPGSPNEGDSGGPLYVRLPAPHDSWRVLGVLVKSFVASPPWQFVEWMLLDPQVEAAAILPCHDVDGQWSPGPDCGGFPRSPQTGSGGWLHGPMACHDEDVSDLEATCGPPYVQPMPAPPPTPALAGPAAPPEEQAASCSAAPTQFSALGLLILAGLGFALRPRRGRASRGPLLALAALALAACSNDESSSGTDTTAGDTGGEDEPGPSPLVLNPIYHRVHSGMNFEDQRYDQLAVGNVARGVDDPGCCLDLVVAGADSPWAVVLFGGGSTERGLTFLDPRPRQLYKLAGSDDGVRDLTLVDLDQDGYNDLLSLTTAGELGLRRGRADDGDGSYFEALVLFDVLPGEQLVAMELGDLDCDGDLDLAIAAPSAGGVVALAQTKVGVFGQAELVATPAAPEEDDAGAAVDLAIGDFDNAGAQEIVSANDDGTLSFYAREGCNGSWDAVGSARFHARVGDCMELEPHCVDSIDHADVLASDNFCDTQLDDVTVGYKDRVLVFCNDGNLVAKIAPTGDDRRWDINGNMSPKQAQVRGVEWRPAEHALYVHDTKKLYRLGAPGEVFFDINYPIVDTFVKPGPISELELHSHTAAGGSWWERIAWVGTAEDSSHVGMAR